MLEIFVVVIVPALVVVAAVSDLMTMTIPNRLVLALLAAFAVAAPLSGMSLQDFATHIGAGLAVLALGVALFAPGWIGGGDAKLAAALALWLGFEPLLAWIVLFGFLGGGLTLAVLWARSNPLPARLTGVDWIARLHDARSGVPYGIALSAGALTLWTDTSWFAGLS
ncbi:prepilin peptidase [Chelatococcus sambhunathii]|uniref:Prepilin peptidase n=1 Tax=Chelatococcus sambhunathii TaxID=363953 RepID=A0ABU1DDS5_9HYPH|nr:prepilin peptidase [Chelatococcus sambhunathii]MDR4306267.1 prepilin peptidase [Chelatococcus sambhunathii]